MLTRLTGAGETVASFNEGADDYVPKPYDSQVLVARIKAVAGRGHKARSLREAKRLLAEGLALDRLDRSINVDGVQLELRNLEFRLLEFLMINHDQVFTRAELQEKVWQSEPSGSELRDVYGRTVDKQISAVRVALANVSRRQFIGTSHGNGYYFIGPVTGA
jgi:DNA-binding response OmpR family regulator